jgi:hypothetical protein
MPEVINWSTGVSVQDGPALSVNGSLSVDAYSKLQVSIDQAAGTEQQVVLAGNGSSIVLLYARASEYGNPADPGAALLYRVNAADPSTNATIGAPLYLLGAPAVNLLDASGVQSLTFTNNTGSPVTVDIIAGIDATP